MRRIKIALAGVLVFSPLAANAVVIDIDVSGFSEGASLSGSFSGADANNDNFLDFGELTDFAMDWSGNSIVAAFSHTFGQLAETYTSTNAFDFRYDILNMDLLSFSSCESLTPDSCFRPTAFRSSGSGAFAVQGQDLASDSSLASNARYASVSEPGTLALLFLGFAGIGFAQRRQG